MVTYIYFVKCPNCEDEHFDFFDEAKEFALGCLSQKPIITQTEVCRNDFGECTDHSDLGTVWSWEDAMKDAEGRYTEAEPTKSIFTKDDLKRMADGQDPEFDDDDFYFDNGLVEEVAPVRFSFRTNSDREEFFKLCREIGIITGADLRKFMEETNANDGNLLDKLRAYRAELGDDFKIEECQRKPIPEGMTIEQLVEEMEENEDTVECTWCNDLFDKSECRKEVDLGWLCSRCEAAIKSRGETLTFKENNYWDFLDESVEDARTLEELVKDSINHLTSDLGKDPWADDFVDDVIADIEKNYDTYVPENIEQYNHWCSAVACEVSRQVNSDYKLEEDTEPKKRIWTCYINGKDVGTVEATTEEEAYREMEKSWNINNEDAQVIEEAVEPKIVHDLGNTYDGGYPAEGGKLAELEDADEYSKRLTTCPECGEKSYDAETTFCISCGFN